MVERKAIDEIIGLLYRGACEAGLWQRALEVMQVALDASVVSLVATWQNGHRHEVVLTVGPGAPKNLNGRDVSDLWREFPLTIGSGELAIVDWAALAKVQGENSHSTYIAGMHERGIDRSMVYTFATRDNRLYTLAVSRSECDRTFSEADMETTRTIGHHFAEALRVRKTFAVSYVKEQHQSQALDKLGIAGLLVDRLGAVTPLNPASEKLLSVGDSLRLRNDRLVAVHRKDDKLLQSALEQIFSGNSDTVSCVGISLQRMSEKRPLGLVINAVQALSVTSNKLERCALIFARGTDCQLATKASLLQSLFSFTPTEAKLAAGLAMGRRLDEIENVLKIRHNTARAHLRSIFSKTDVTRQAELVSLLANSVAPLAMVEHELTQAA
jgi:DNA-binding CsgD family transcriptional regulator